MIDSMGNARSLIIIGTQLNLTPVLISKFIRASTSRVVLITAVDETNPAAHPGAQLQDLDAVVAHARGQGATNLEVRKYQPGNVAELEQQISEAFAVGDIDLAITTTTSQYAAPRLGSREAPFDSLSIAKATQTFTEGLVMLRQLANCMASQGSGHLVALTDAETLDDHPIAEAASTVGIDSYAQSLGETAKSHGVRVIRARASRVGLMQKPTSPQDLAIAISEALLKKRKNTVKVIAD
ncbi:MAG: hypothetical protein WAS05_01950 [Candidatus Nanopelagicales bacterium]